MEADTDNFKGSVIQGGHPSGDNSPRHDYLHTMPGDESSDEQLQYEDDANSVDRSWDGHDSLHEHGLGEPAMSMSVSESQEHEKAEHAVDGPLPRDIQRRTTFYDYAAEKQMSFADAKHFYQRSQADATREDTYGSQHSQPSSPMLNDKPHHGFSAIEADLQRVGSFRSIGSGLSMTHVAQK
jgi:AMP deaminase